MPALILFFCFTHGIRTLDQEALASAPAPPTARRRTIRGELEAAAGRNGWQESRSEDAGISGAKGREKRPAFDRMLKAAVRREFDVIMAWSVDRLGRSLQDLVTFLSDIHAKSVELYLHQQGIDTTTPSGKAMFQMMGVFAEFERAMVRERVLAGLSAPGRRGKSWGGQRYRQPRNAPSEPMLQPGSASARSWRGITSARPSFSGSRPKWQAKGAER